MFNLAGALFYLLVSTLALRAGFRSATSLGGRAKSTLHWYAVAMLFLVLAAWRLGDGETVVHALAREAARGAGSYETRRTWQAPLVAAVILGCSAWALRHILAPHRDWAMHWSRFASVALVIYSAVRTVSFHPVDALIYAGVGPFHVNHIIDLGLAASVGYFAYTAEVGLQRGATARSPGRGESIGRR